jgi:hypothetical protein
VYALRFTVALFAFINDQHTAVAPRQHNGCASAGRATAYYNNVPDFFRHDACKRLWLNAFR